MPRKGTDKRLPEIHELLLKGYKAKDIAKELNMSLCKVYILVKLLKSHKNQLEEVYKEFNPYSILSITEKKVYKEIVEHGMFSREKLAKKLYITQGTASQHIHAIMMKLNCSCIAEIIFKHYKKLDEFRKKRVEEYLAQQLNK